MHVSLSLLCPSSALSLTTILMSGLAQNLIRPTYRSPVYRLIARKSKRVGPLALLRHASSGPRPYRFHIGASWAGKPPQPGLRRRLVPFASDSAIGAWRDDTLSRSKSVSSKDAGEDFFYVQEVSLQPQACNGSIHVF